MTAERTPPERPRRFFGSVTAAARERPRELGRFGLDLVSHRQAGGAEIGGLVTVDDMGRLVESGYRVVVHETDQPRRKHEYTTFEPWRDELLSDLERPQDKS